MIEYDFKYVFHVPLYRYTNGELVLVEIDDILSELLTEFHRKGFEGLYMTQVKSMYKARLYDEILITVFSTPEKSPVGIFRDWFGRNNHVLAQEALAYECGGRMIVEKL